MYDYRKQLWLNPDIDYIFNADIVEYDMTDAGFSLIQEFHLLPDYQIDALARIKKGMVRHIEIGKLQRNNQLFSTQLNDKFAEMRLVFIDMNGLSDDDILTVKKDAIFTLKRCDRIEFGKVKFRPKNKYSSYVRFPSINNMELFYNGEIEMKGMSNLCLNRHRLYMQTFLQKIIEMIEEKDSRTKRWLMKFISDYKFRELEDPYYLEFNNRSDTFNPMFNYINVILPFVQIVQKEIP